ncbi:hypothetical protein V499_04226 [Pseudogymnoascus sp. VKM F-103]|uniref:ferric-chelate reductase (NADPH) n=1 Tax=Pseudogymnoascus verrucosus TaxID=342668 RepID=A0A2P2SWI2_9PEZI|nr:uncharacterized protein VE01_00927 [Pseudogymnoascus verrucosus]KFY75809.1 hypothetical protein V499_04226 [Pseudogymnoascus sp. VKM F-103]OBU01203.1 hypothetical protein VE01_00927 [Pseudogymnoascus verrucosus]
MFSAAWTMGAALGLLFLTQGAKADAESEAILIEEADSVTNLFHKFLFIICGVVAVIFIIWRVLIVSVKYMRQLVCLTNEKQRYFQRPYKKYASLKKYLLYAPIFHKRHNREFQLSTAMNMGVLPTRFQLLALIAYVGTNIAFCLSRIHWDQPLSVVSVEIRHRSGILAVVNMIPLFVMSTRNNPLIHWLDISFDTFNLLHRWFGRIVVIETLLHTFSWVVATVHRSDWATVAAAFQNSEMMVFGLIGAAAMVAIMIQSLSFVRHAFYETFKYLHIMLAITVLVGIWYHLKLAGLHQTKYLIVAIVIWALERTIRVLIVVYRNMGRGGTKALLEALPGNAVRVTLNVARPWTFTPGQHAYLYMPSIGAFTSHPFSVAWSQEEEDPLAGDGLVGKDRQDVLAIRKTTMSFVIRARTGFTNTLLQKAEAAPEGKMFTRCFVEGPYGGAHLMRSYGTVVLFAGGIGITHQVPHVRDLVTGYANGTVAARRVLLVWIIQSPEHLEWIRPWMTEILAMDKRRDILRIMLFISRPRSTKEIHSPSATVQMFPGRPNIETLLDMEVENQVGAMGVSVCGSGSLSDDVRSAARSRQHKSNIDFVEEAFTW